MPLAIDPLINLFTDKDESIRMHAANSLGNIVNSWEPNEANTSKIIDALVKAYKQEDQAIVQSRITNALLNIKSSNAVDALTNVVQNEKDDNLRVSAINALGTIGYNLTDTTKPKSPEVYTFNRKKLGNPEVNAKLDAQQKQIVKL